MKTEAAHRRPHIVLQQRQAACFSFLICFVWHGSILPIKSFFFLQQHLRVELKLFWYPIGKTALKGKRDEKTILPFSFLVCLLYFSYSLSARSFTFTVFFPCGSRERSITCSRALPGPMSGGLHIVGGHELLTPVLGRPHDPDDRALPAPAPGGRAHALAACPHARWSQPARQLPRVSLLLQAGVTEHQIYAKQKKHALGLL